MAHERFSDRVGATKLSLDLQIDSMNADLKSVLWNWILDTLNTEMPERLITGRDYVNFASVAARLWDGFYHKPKDELDILSHDDIQRRIRGWFLDSKWYEAYNFLEYLVAIPITSNDQLIDRLNWRLETLHSGYRLIGRKFAPVTHPAEVSAIEEALDEARAFGLRGVYAHLRSAVELLSKKPVPDLRNSMKESISAVESLCCTVTKKEKATLGDALKAIEAKVPIHPALKSGFSNIYGYASDEGGIRHKLVDESNVDFDDAKWMLVSCSAFVHYLIGKASRHGLPIKV